MQNVSSNMPSYGGGHPAHGNNHPAHGDDHPVHGSNHPVHGADQASNSNTIAPTTDPEVSSNDAPQEPQLIGEELQDIIAALKQLISKLTGSGTANEAPAQPQAPKTASNSDAMEELIAAFDNAIDEAVGGQVSETQAPAGPASANNAGSTPFAPTEAEESGENNISSSPFAKILEMIMLLLALMQGLSSDKQDEDSEDDDSTDLNSNNNNNTPINF